MRLSGVFDHRVRGFRVVEVGGLAVLLVLVLAVYLSKTGAGGERADIDHTQQQIDDEQVRIRLLKAEVANLERPDRLEDLSSRYLGLQPISIKHEIQPDALPDLALTVARDAEQAHAQASGQGAQAPGAQTVAAQTQAKPETAAQPPGGQDSR